MKIDIDENKYIVKKSHQTDGSFTIKVKPKHYNCFGCNKKYNRTKNYNIIQDDSIKYLVVPKQFCNDCKADVVAIQSKIINTRKDYRRRW